MKQANISTLKNNLSRYLDYVRKGGVVRVYDRDRPVAEVVPVGATATAGAGDPGPLSLILDDLEQRGIVRRGSGAPGASGTIAASKLSGPLPATRASVVGALIEERRQGR